MIDIITGTAFDAPKRLHHREDEGALEFPSSVGSRARGLLALKAFNWRTARGGSWTNPYITNGLVAMWDGEWNAGGGVHDGAATVWKDIVGTYDCTVRAGVEWGGLYATCSSAVKSWAFCASAIQDQINTIEVVMTRASSGVLFCSGQTPSNADVRTSNKYNSNTLYCNTATIAVMSGTAVINALKDSPEPHHIAFKGGVSKIYVNGVGYIASTSSAGGIISSDHISIGGREYNAGNSLIGDKIYCLRIYSRALTDDEVAENYAVDKARFGLT